MCLGFVVPNGLRVGFNGAMNGIMPKLEVKGLIPPNVFFHEGQAPLGDSVDILRVVWVSGVTVFVTRVAVASVVAMGLRALSAQMPLSKPGGGIACVLESLSESPFIGGKGAGKGRGHKPLRWKGSLDATTHVGHAELSRCLSGLDAGSCG